MRVITKTVYTYAEILKLGNTRAIERARTWLADAATPYEWWEAVYDYWNAELEKVGFVEPEINFSGFWSQGDGASFTAVIDIEKAVAIDSKYARLGRLIDWVSGVVERTSHQYCHENTCRVVLNPIYDAPHTLAMAYEFRDDLEDLRKQLCRKIYADLQKEYEWLTSDENLKELSEINDFTFDENGRIECST